MNLPDDIFQVLYTGIQLMSGTLLVYLNLFILCLNPKLCKWKLNPKSNNNLWFYDNLHAFCLSKVLTKLLHVWLIIMFTKWAGLTFP